MKTKVNCPCGELIAAHDEDELVRRTTAHLEVEHGRSYSRDEILFMAR